MIISIMISTLKPIHVMIMCLKMQKN